MNENLLATRERRDGEELLWDEVFRSLRSFAVKSVSRLCAINSVLLAVTFVALLWSFSVRGSDSPGGGEAVECANLIYAGTKSSVCFSEEFLSAVASETS